MRSKASSTGTVYSKSSRALTFEKFYDCCQAGVSDLVGTDGDKCEPIGSKFSKISSIGIVYGTYSRALTFEKFYDCCQAGVRERDGIDGEGDARASLRC